METYTWSNSRDVTPTPAGAAASGTAYLCRWVDG